MDKIYIKNKYITLIQLLKFKGFVNSGGEIKNFLDKNKIFLNNVLVFEKRKKIYNNDTLKINNENYLILCLKTN